MKLLNTYLAAVSLSAAAMNVNANALSDDQRSIVEDGLRELVVQQLNKVFENNPASISFRRIDNEGSSLRDGYAVDYDWKHSWSKDYGTENENLKKGLTESLYYGGHKLDLFATGSYAWEDAVNKESLSKIGLSGSLVRAFTPSPDNNMLTEAMTSCLKDPVADPAQQVIIDAEAKECFQKYSHPRILGQESYTFDSGLHYHVEGDQDFTEKQNAYGAHFSAAISPHKESKVQLLNVPDWLFMLSRWAFNGDQPFQLDSYRPNFPTMTLKYEQVDPTDNDPRKSLVGGDKRFERFVFVSAFSTQVARYENKAISFEWAYHRYLEDGAPDSVEDARQDDFEFQRFSLFLPTKLFGLEDLDGNHQVFVRYAKGELPFDITNDGAVSIGWETDLDNLLKLIK